MLISYTLFFQFLQLSSFGILQYISIPSGIYLRIEENYWPILKQFGRFTWLCGGTLYGYVRKRFWGWFKEAEIVLDSSQHIMPYQSQSYLLFLSYLCTIIRNRTCLWSTYLSRSRSESETQTKQSYYHEFIQWEREVGRQQCLLLFNKQNNSSNFFN